MAEYIERKALIEKIVNTPTVPIRKCYEGNFVYADGTASRQNEIIDYINEQPTADVVEVVRCKDCEMARETEDERYLFCMQFADTVGFRAFCSYGVKKEGAKNETE